MTGLADNHDNSKNWHSYSAYSRPNTVLSALYELTGWCAIEFSWF